MEGQQTVHRAGCSFRSIGISVFGRCQGSEICLSSKAADRFLAIKATARCVTEEEADAFSAQSIGLPRHRSGKFGLPSLTMIVVVTLQERCVCETKTLITFPLSDRNLFHCPSHHYLCVTRDTGRKCPLVADRNSWDQRE